MFYIVAKNMSFCIFFYVHHTVNTLWFGRNTYISHFKTYMSFCACAQSCPLFVRFFAGLFATPRTVGKAPLPTEFSRWNLFNPGSNQSLFLHWQVDSLPLVPPGKPHKRFCACMLSCFSHVLLFVTLWTIACEAPLDEIL